MGQTFLTGIPLFVLTKDHPQTNYFLKSTIVFVMAMSLMLTTFVPKFYNFRSREQMQATSRATSHRKGSDNVFVRQFDSSVRDEKPPLLVKSDAKLQMSLDVSHSASSGASVFKEELQGDEILTDKNSRKSSPRPWIVDAVSELSMSILEALDISTPAGQRFVSAEERCTRNASLPHREPTIASLHDSAGFLDLDAVVLEEGLNDNNTPDDSKHVSPLRPRSSECSNASLPQRYPSEVEPTFPYPSSPSSSRNDSKSSHASNASYPVRIASEVEETSIER